MRTVLLAVVAALVLASAASATFPGKNGRLVYSTDDAQLYSVLPTGKGLRRISDGIDFGASFSPDGKSIAFSRQEGESPLATIWTAAADGSGAHRVTDAAAARFLVQPSWTRDGRIVYADASCIWAVPATQLTCGGGEIVQYPLPSPVDDRLAFFRSRPRDGRAGMISADQLWLGDAATSVLATKGDWSPDGTRLLLRLADGTLAVLGVETGALTKLALKTSDFTWSPDGKQIAYVAKGRIWIAAVDGTRPRAVVTVGEAGGLAWQPLPR